jgi:hypothetical protein
MNIKLANIIILSIIFLVVACHDVDLIIDRSAFEPHRPPALAGWGENVPDRLKNGETLQYRGIYAEEPHGRIGLIRQFDRRQGWSHAVLSDLLPVTEGTLVSVSGRVVTVERTITGTGRIHRSHRLEPDDVEVIMETGPAQEQARRIYARIRPRLQDQISLPGSKLVLAAEPLWRVDWLKGEKALVVVAYNFDLMYAAETQFLFSLEGQRLEKIYFMEWFKGE